MVQGNQSNGGGRKQIKRTVDRYGWEFTEGRTRWQRTFTHSHLPPPLLLPSPHYTHTYTNMNSNRKTLPFSSASGMRACAKFYLNPKDSVAANPWIKLISTQSNTRSLRTSEKNVLDRTLSVASWLKHKERLIDSGNPNHGKNRSGRGFRIDSIQKLRYHGDPHLPFVPLLVDRFISSYHKENLALQILMSTSRGKQFT